MERVRKKAKGVKLYKLGRVRLLLETDKRIHFRVRGETEEHSVIFDKVKGEWSCDCKFFSLKEKECSHLIACELYLQSLRK